MVIEPLLVVSVAAFNLAVMPWCLWPDCLVDNVKSTAKNIQRMDSICFLRVGKLSAVVRLDHFWRITKVNNCTLHKVYRTVAAGFLVGIDEPFSTRFFYHGILVEFFAVRTDITGSWHVFYVHLPLFAQFCWRIIVSQMLGFFLRGFHFLPVSKPDKHAIQ